MRVVGELGWWMTMLMLGWGGRVGVARWFLAFSTCGWNAHQSRPYISVVRRLGVNTAKQGVWKQPVYKAHLDKGQLGGTAQNRGAPGKDEGNSTARR